MGSRAPRAPCTGVSPLSPIGRTTPPRSADYFSTIGSGRAGAGKDTGNGSSRDRARSKDDPARASDDPASASSDPAGTSRDPAHRPDDRGAATTSPAIASGSSAGAARSSVTLAGSSVDATCALVARSCQVLGLAAHSVHLAAVSKRKKPPPPDDDDSPPGGDPEAPRHTPEEVAAMLKLPEVRERMVAVIRASASKKIPDDDVNEIFQRASQRAVEAEKRPFVGGNTVAWFGRVTAFEALDFHRERARQRARIDDSEGIEEYVENLAAAADDDTDEDEGFYPWLAKAVARHDKDRETFELMMRKAREQLTSADVAKIAGISTNAYDKRVQALTAKYTPLRKRYLQRRHAMMLLLKIFFVSAVVLGIALAIWKWLAKDDIRPDPDELRRGKALPAPSAPLPPAPTFDQALPTPSPPQPPPPRLKP